MDQAVQRATELLHAPFHAANERLADALLLVEEKTALMRKLGKRRLVLRLAEPLVKLPAALDGWPVEIEEGGAQLAYTFANDTQKGAAQIIQRLGEAGVHIKDVAMSESSLEQIFVDLVGAAA